MHCRNCGYALWNLTQPFCPECGTPFDLRTYCFTPGSVAFACPHCNALHSGTGDCFIPAVTDTAICNQCHQIMTVTRMRVVPLTDDAATRSGLMPWDDRRSLGIFRAWWLTVKASMFEPTDMMRKLLPGSTVTAAFGFAFMTYLLVALIQVLVFSFIALAGWFMLSHSSLLSSPMNTSSPANNGQFVIIVLTILGANVFVLFSLLVLAQALMMPLFSFVFIALPAHLYLKLFQAKTRSFRYTARAILYAQGPMALLAFPVCGLYLAQIFWIWSLILTILMIAVAHRIHGGQATLAVLWLPGILIFLGIIAPVVVILATQYHWF